MYTLMDNYTGKPLRIGYPKIYLGADIGKVDYGDGPYVWKISQDYFVREYIRNAKKRMKYDNVDFNKKIYDIHYSPKNPFYAV